MRIALPINLIFNCFLPHGRSKHPDFKNHYWRRIFLFIIISNLEYKIIGELMFGRELPSDALIAIIAKLPCKEIISLLRCSRAHRDFISDIVVWRHLLKRDFHLDTLESENPKDTYIECVRQFRIDYVRLTKFVNARMQELKKSPELNEIEIKFYDKICRHITDNKMLPFFTLSLVDDEILKEFIFVLINSNATSIVKSVLRSIPVENLSALIASSGGRLLIDAFFSGSLELVEIIISFGVDPKCFKTRSGDLKDKTLIDYFIYLIEGRLEVTLDFGLFCNVNDFFVALPVFLKLAGTELDEAYQDTQQTRRERLQHIKDRVDAMVGRNPLFNNFVDMQKLLNEIIDHRISSCIPRL